MKKPELPLDESQRLNSLRATGLLDSNDEERFDRVTRLARRLFDVPIALVSLVDENRQWFKSRQGLDASETSREISFCGHTILNEDAFIVSDALADARFRDNPLVTGDPRIRFYAGQPLKVSGGHRIGTLCLIDRKPREMSGDDLELLQDLSRMVEEQLDAMALATVDELTQICNRRGFQMLADKAVSAGRRMEQDLSLFAFDLNNFKDINDREGHAAGDQALNDFAACLVDCFRDCDVIGRVGGDEFQVLLTNAGKRAVQQLLGRFQDVVSAHNHLYDRPYRLSYAVGTATGSAQEGNCLQCLTLQADEAMYVQKRYKARAGESGDYQLQMGQIKANDCAISAGPHIPVTGLTPGRLEEAPRKTNR